MGTYLRHLHVHMTVALGYSTVYLGRIGIINVKKVVDMSVPVLCELLGWADQ
jgi:hypothetical protein